MIFYFSIVFFCRVVSAVRIIGNCYSSGLIYFTLRWCGRIGFRLHLIQNTLPTVVVGVNQMFLQHFFPLPVLVIFL